MSEVEGKIATQPNSNAPPTGKWTTGLYDCLDDKGNCCYTWCSPTEAFGSNAEIIDQGRTSARRARLTYFGLGCFGLGCLYSYKFRMKLRSLYNLPEEPCSDGCVHNCCILCAICQEYRELKNRGLDPSIEKLGVIYSDVCGLLQTETPGATGISSHVFPQC